MTAREGSRARARREVETALLTRAAELNAAIGTCHLRVDCPRCGATVGDKCVRVNSKSVRTLKSPHTERIRAAGISLR